MRYNPETDWTQIKVNGVWTNWLKAGMQLYKIFYDGQFHNGQSIGAQVTGVTMYGGLSVQDGLISGLNNTGGYNSGYGSILALPVDLTNYTELCVVCSIDNQMHTLDVSSITGEKTIALYSWLTSAGLSMYMCVIPKATTDVQNPIAEYHLTQGNNNPITVSQLYLQ